MYRKIIWTLLCLSLPISAHEWTPTYPKLKYSFVEGVLVTQMTLFNSRKDVNYYEVSVWDKDWNSVPFSTADRVVRVNHLQRKRIDVYVRQKDKDTVVYICSKSKILSDDEKGTIVSSRICSKIKK